MKIFITGIAGFLGSHLADRMISLGHDVSGNDNLIGGYLDNVNPKAKFYHVDCCDQPKMSSIIAGSDILIHTAATAHEGLSVFSPDFITRNIFQASVSTISAAISSGVKHFLFCSSMARYGNQASPFYETFDPRPVDPYGISKVAVEQILKTLSAIHGMTWNIAVPHNIVGPRQRYDDPFRNVMSIMINRNLQNKPAIIYGDGNQTRCFSFIDDCVYCLEKMALDETIRFQTVNIGPDEGSITINKLANLVAMECGFDGDPIYMDDRPSEVKHAVCSSDLARKILDYKTNYTIEHAVKSTVDYIRNNGVKPFNYSYPLEIINNITPHTWKDRLM
jgi:UDP-glucose 4-epimerase